MFNLRTNFFLTLVILATWGHELRAQTILQGELIEASRVRFELVDGLAFQNSIRVIVDEQELGHFLGTGGTWARTLERKVEQLNQERLSHNGSFYLPLATRSVRGRSVIEQIIHFPDQPQTLRQSGSLDSCKRELVKMQSKLQTVFDVLAPSLEANQLRRAPASVLQEHP
jgi:hypothetical protein